MVLALSLCYGQGRTPSSRGGSSMTTSRTMTSSRTSSPRMSSPTATRTYTQSSTRTHTTSPARTYTPSATRTRTDVGKTHSTSVSTHSATTRPQTYRNAPQRPNMSHSRPISSGQSHNTNYGGGHHHDIHHSEHHHHHHHDYHHTYCHPHHHHDVHFHLCYWNPYVPIVHYYGVWEYGHLYYRPTYVERYDHINYINSTYHIEIVDFVSDGSYIYTIQKVDGYRYFRVINDENRLVAQYRLNRRYTKLVYDDSSNGVWAMTNNEKHSMLFIYENENLICYED